MFIEGLKVAFGTAIGLSVALLGCGGKTVHSTNDLEAPVLWWRHVNNGLCSTTRAVDRQRRLWAETGCETASSGWDDIGSLSPSGVDALRAQFSRLPDQESSRAPDCHGRLHAFGRREAGVSERNWIACGTGAMLGDLAGLEEPYLSLAMAFQHLE